MAARLGGLTLQYRMPQLNLIMHDSLLFSGGQVGQLALQYTMAELNLIMHNPLLCTGGQVGGACPAAAGARKNWLD